jgi:hypothetical protein
MTISESPPPAPSPDGHLRARYPAAVGAALLGLGALLALLMDERMLPRMPRTVGGILGVGVVLVLRGALRVWSRQPLARRVWWGVGAIVVVAVATFMTYSLGFYWKRTVDMCSDALTADTLEARAALLVEGQRHRRSVFSLLPEVIGFRAYTCDAAEQNLALLRAGVCPTSFAYLSTAIPCLCGEDRWSAERCATGRGSCASAEGARPARIECLDALGRVVASVGTASTARAR